MKNILFFGPPGCGKGTQASALSNATGYLNVSTGSLFRKIVNENSPLGKKIQEIMGSGALVKDELVNQLIEDFYKKSSSAKGIILDGYPRNIDQANALKLVLQQYNAEVDVVFYFNLEESLLIKRITGRYTCSDCGAIYNSYFKNTKKEDECDICHSHKLIRRSDDSEEVSKNRLKVYKEDSKPLLDYYKDKLVTLDASKPQDLLSKEIINLCSNS